MFIKRRPFHGTSSATFPLEAADSCVRRNRKHYSVFKYKHTDAADECFNQKLQGRVASPSEEAELIHRIDTRVL